jgi:hypothetical protein
MSPTGIAGSIDRASGGGIVAEDSAESPARLRETGEIVGGVGGECVRRRARKSNDAKKPDDTGGRCGFYSELAFCGRAVRMEG